MTATAPVGKALDRRFAWLFVAVTTVCLAVAGAVLVPWGGATGGLEPATVDSAFTPAQVARAEVYAGAVRALSLTATGVSLGLALLLGLTRAGAALARPAHRRLPWWAAVPTAALVLVVLGSLATLPFGLLVRRRNLEVGLTTQSLSGWLTDRALSALVAWLAASVLLLLVVAAARRSPRRWFVGAGLAAAGGTVVLSMLYPLLVEPLFNRFEPMPDGRLRSSLLELARAQDVEVEEVLVADASRRTTALNAYVSGIGGTRRVVVYDNLLADLPAAQVRSVVAHEVAHARHHDVVVGTGLGALGALLGVGILALLLDSPTLRRRAGIRGPADPGAAALVLALVAVGTLVAAPVQNTVSRAIEARADRVALEVTDDAESFRRLQVQLALRSLADPTPPPWRQVWFGSHPTVLERLGAADAYQRTTEGRR